MQTSNRRQFQFVRLIGSILPVVVLTGCVTTYTPQPEERSSEAQHTFVKNYTVGQSITVNVGEPMIKFQDYWAEDIESRVATPSQTVYLRGGPGSMTLYAGRKYPVRGTINFEGTDYVVIADSDDRAGYRAVLVRPDGTLFNRFAISMPPDWSLILVVNTVTDSDPAVRMIRESTTNITTTNGYENFELLYAGINGNALNVTYREFSPEGFARVAFFQNLTYEAGAKSITFKKFKISVDHASSESITFTVLSDGR